MVVLLVIKSLPYCITEIYYGGVTVCNHELSKPINKTVRKRSQSPRFLESNKHKAVPKFQHARKQQATKNDRAIENDRAIKQSKKITINIDN